jgi:hypothetical protein
MIMGKRMDWRRCKLQGRAHESKHGSAVELPNGARAALVPKDDLARRADKAMRAWQRRLSPRDRQRIG